jgi:hypothetical protein
MRAMKIPTLVAAASVLWFTPAPASAKQCVYNHGWFALKYAWLRADTGSVASGGALMKNGQNCTSDDGTYIAVLSIDGAKVADFFFKRLDAIGPQLLGQVPTIGPVLQGLADGTLPGLPPADQIFYKGVPSSDHYLDVSGTIWTPTTGEGGPIH